jgi:hypothetical protein
MHVGNRKNIDLGSSFFRRFIEENLLYVDKTSFIEHVLEDKSSVLLFCRPRRMGKTLNLDTLRTFLDVKGDAAAQGLFSGLAIEDSPYFAEAHSRPVVWLSFRDLKPHNYRAMLASKVKEQLAYYLNQSQWPATMVEHLADLDTFYDQLLYDLTQTLHSAYGTEPYLLIDEYDKLLMDAVGTPQFNEVRDFTKSVLLSVLKDNPSLGKGVLTGVNRIAQESLFSDLNNLDVYDVLRKSAYDADFGFTEAEVAELCTPEELAVAREWYNGYRIGDEKVYFTYSVMNYLKNGTPNNYWGRSGTMDTIKGGLTLERFEEIAEIIGGDGAFKRKVELADRLSAHDMDGFPHDDAFYSLLVQTGYLTYDRTDVLDEYQIYLPNRELKQVWERFILTGLFDLRSHTIRDSLALLKADTLDEFSLVFGALIDSRLSYMDFTSESAEHIHHAFVAGILAAVGMRFSSNREAGLGRYDICAFLPDKTMIFEFKEAEGTSDTPADKRPVLLNAAAEAALRQIRDRNYAAEAPGGLPVYAVGIGFLGKSAAVRAVMMT